MVEIGRTGTLLSLFLLALASSAARAQVPKPPQLMTGAGGWTTSAEFSGDAPSGNIIFRETFESMPLGPAVNVTNRWMTATDGGTRTIANTTPVSSGFGKYYEARVVKSGVTNFRAEYVNIGAPGGPPAMPLIDAGGGNRRASEAYWYGYIVCLDVYNANPQVRIHLNQFHTRNEPANSHNPVISLAANATEMRVLMEASYEGGGVGVQANVLSDNLFQNPLNQCVKVIWQVLFDSRLSTNGTTGLVRAWVGTLNGISSTPSYEWVNKSVGHRVDTLEADGYMYRVSMGCYCSLWRWSGVDGQEFKARFDNYTVMDSTGSFEAMSAALSNPD